MTIAETKSQPPVHVVMISDAAGLPGLAVTGYTALKNSSRPVHIWAVVDGVSRSAQRRLTECWKRTGKLADVRFLPYGKVPLSFKASHLPPGSYVRLLLPSILPPDIPRYAYLDIDVLVGADVAELVDTDLHGRPIGMVINRGFEENVRAYVRDQLGVDPDDYYNAGILLIDAEAFRRDNHGAGLLETGVRMPATWFADNDILNVYFQGKIFPLDEKWNLRSKDHPMGDYILHFAGGAKPWQNPPVPGMPVSEMVWHEMLRESGFIVTPSDSARGVWMKWRHRFFSKGLRQYLRLRDRLVGAPAR